MATRQLSPNQETSQFFANWQGIAPDIDTISTEVARIRREISKDQCPKSVSLESLLSCCRQPWELFDIDFESLRAPVNNITTWLQAPKTALESFTGQWLRSHNPTKANAHQYRAINRLICEVDTLSKDKEISAPIYEGLVKIKGVYEDFIGHCCQCPDEHSRTAFLSGKALLQGGEIGYRFLKPEAKAALSRHQSSLSHQGVSFIRNPATPAIQIAASSLLSSISNLKEIHPRLAKIKVWIESSLVQFPVLLTKAPEGPSLLEFFAPSGAKNLMCQAYKDDDWMSKVNNFSIMIVYGILTDPFDTKLEHFTVEKIQDKYYIRCTENGLAFSNIYIERSDSKTQKAKRHLDVKYPLFFFKQMDSPIDPDFKTHFLSLSPDRIVLQWLKTLINDQIDYIRLFQDGVIDTKEMVQMRLSLGLIVGKSSEEGLIDCLYSKIQSMQTAMKNKPDLTHRELFYASHPDVAQYYQEIETSASEDKRNPYDLTKALYYSDHATQAIQKMLPDTQLSCCKLALSSLTAKKNGVQSPTPTETLPQALTRFLQQIDWQYQTKATLDLLLSIRAIPRIYFRDCHLLQDTHLKRIGKSFYHLKEVVLINCPEITIKGLEALLQAKPDIKLVVGHCPQITARDYFSLRNQQKAIFIQISDQREMQLNHESVQDLHDSIHTCDLEAVKYLLDININPNTPDECGKSPLHTAVSCSLNNLEIAKRMFTALVFFGADPETLYENETPLQKAQKQAPDHPEMADFIKRLFKAMKTGQDVDFLADYLPKGVFIDLGRVENISLESFKKIIANLSPREIGLGLKLSGQHQLLGILDHLPPTCDTEEFIDLGKAKGITLENAEDIIAGLSKGKSKLVPKVSGEHFSPSADTNVFITALHVEGTQHDFNTLAGSLARGSSETYHSALFKISKTPFQYFLKILRGQRIRKLVLRGLIDGESADERAKDVAESLKSLPIEHLDLSENKISDNGAKALVEILDNCPISYLNLSNNQITDKGALTLANSFKTRSQLFCLRLECNKIGHEGTYAVLKALEGSRIRELHLNPGTAISTGILAQSLPSYKNLTHLHLHNDGGLPTVKYAKGIVQGLENCQHFIRLGFSSTSTPTDTFFELLALLSKTDLKEFIVANAVGKEDFVTLVKASGLVCLTGKFSKSQKWIWANFVNALAKDINDFHLDALLLEGIGEEDLKAIVPIITNSRIKLLDLKSESIGNAGAKIIAREVHGSCLETIKLHLNHAEDEGLEAFAEEIGHPPLNHFAFSSKSGTFAVQIGQPEPSSLDSGTISAIDGETTLLTSTKTAKTMQRELVTPYAMIGGFKSIYQTIKGYPITQLHIDLSKSDEEGFESIVELIKGFSVEQLIISGPKISINQMVAIVEAIQHSHVENLRFNGQLIDCKGLANLVKISTDWNQTNIQVDGVFKLSNRCLDFQDREIPDSILIPLAEMLPQTKLESICAKGWKKEILSACLPNSELEEVDLRQWEGIKNERDIIALANVLSKSTIKAVNVGDHWIGKVLNALLPQSGITELEVSDSDTSLSETEAVMLATLIKGSKITHLRLRNCILGSRGFRAFLEILPQLQSIEATDKYGMVLSALSSDSEIEVLDLIGGSEDSYNPFSTQVLPSLENFSLEDFVALSKALQKSKIKKVNMGNHWTGKVLNALLPGSEVTQLDFSNDPIPAYNGYSPIKALADAISGSKIAHLNLRNCPLDDPDFWALFDLLPQLQSIEVDGWKGKVLTALLPNSKTTQLDLSDHRSPHSRPQVFGVGNLGKRGPSTNAQKPPKIELVAAAINGSKITHLDIRNCSIDNDALYTLLAILPQLTSIEADHWQGAALKALLPNSETQQLDLSHLDLFPGSSKPRVLQELEKRIKGSKITHISLGCLFEPQHRRLNLTIPEKNRLYLIGVVLNAPNLKRIEAFGGYGKILTAMLPNSDVNEIDFTNQTTPFLDPNLVNLLQTPRLQKISSIKANGWRGKVLNALLLSGNITLLDLSSEGIDDSGLCELAAILPKCPNLKQLDLSDNCFASHSDNFSTRSLRYGSSQSLLPKGIRALAEALSYTKITHLNLRGNTISSVRSCHNQDPFLETVDALIELAAILPYSKLECIEVDGWRGEVLALMLSDPNCTCLSLSSKNIKDEELVVLEKFLHRYPQFTHWDLSHNGIKNEYKASQAFIDATIELSNEMVKAKALTADFLERLKLAASYLKNNDKKSAEKVFNNVTLHGKLYGLNRSDNLYNLLQDKSAVAALSKGRYFNIHGLKETVMTIQLLSGIFEGNTGLASAMESSENLTELNLSYNELTKETISDIVNALPHCKKLRTLNLRHNCLGDEGAAALAGVLQHTNITHLDLRENDIGFKGFAALVSAIQNRQPGHIEADGWHGIVLKSLLNRTNDNKLTLDFTDCEINNEEIEKLKNLLNNYGIRQLDIELKRPL
ncbi:MAG: hypothetical protein H7A40_04500 [Chlamydiales bacterium]|nr:hypothetical protein [Chlamydiales bacterium]